MMNYCINKNNEEYHKLKDYIMIIYMILYSFGYPLYFVIINSCSKIIKYSITGINVGFKLTSALSNN